jgi:hypothetical protein
MKSRYKTAIAQLRELAHIKTTLETNITDTHEKLGAVHRRAELLAEYLRNEANYVPPAEAKEIEAEVSTILAPLLIPKRAAKSAKPATFNKTAYTLFTVAAICKKANGCTSGEVVKALQESPRKEHYDNPASTYATLNKFTKRGLLKKRKDKFHLTAKGENAAHETAKDLAPLVPINTKKPGN